MIRSAASLVLTSLRTPILNTQAEHNQSPLPSEVQSASIDVEYALFEECANIEIAFAQKDAEIEWLQHELEKLKLRLLTAQPEASSSAMYIPDTHNSEELVHTMLGRKETQEEKYKVDLEKTLLAQERREYEAIIERIRICEQGIEAQRQKSKAPIREIERLHQKYKTIIKNRERLTQKCETLTQSYLVELQKSGTNKYQGQESQLKIASIIDSLEINGQDFGAAIRLLEAAKLQLKALIKELKADEQAFVALIQDIETDKHVLEASLQKNGIPIPKIEPLVQEHVSLIKKIADNNSGVEILIEGLKADKQACKARLQKLTNDKQRRDAALHFLYTSFEDNMLSGVEIQLLVDILENKDKYYKKEYRSDAASMLSGQSSLLDWVRPVLERALQDREEDVRISAASALSSHFQLSDTALQILLKAIANEEGSHAAELRVYVIGMLLQQSSLLDLAQPILERALQDQEEDVKIYAAIALSSHFQLSDTAMALQILLNVVANKEGWHAAKVRGDTITALLKQSSLPGLAQPILEQTLQDQEEDITIKVALLLAARFTLPNAGLQILLKVIANEEGRYVTADRVGATQALLKQSFLPDLAQPILERALQDQNERIKFNAAALLSRHFILPKTDIPILLKALANEKGWYTVVDRARACVALIAQSSLPDLAQPILERALQDQEENIKIYAATALAWNFQLSNTALQILLKVIANEEGKYATARRIDIFKALSKQSPLLPKLAQPVLERALQDQDEMIKVYAALALGCSFSLSNLSLQIVLDVISNKEGTYVVDVPYRASLGLFRQSSLPYLDRNRTQLILETALEGHEKDTKANIACALGRHFSLSDRALQVLLDVIANKEGLFDAAQRLCAFSVLNMQRSLPDRVRPVLEATLQDQEEKIKDRAARILDMHFQ